MCCTHEVLRQPDLSRLKLVTNERARRMIFVILVDQLQSCTLISLIPERVSTERHFLKPELLSGCEPGLWVTEGGGWFGTGLSGVAVSAGWGSVGD